MDIQSRASSASYPIFLESSLFITPLDSEKSRLCMRICSTTEKKLVETLPFTNGYTAKRRFIILYDNSTTLIVSKNRKRYYYLHNIKKHTFLAGVLSGTFYSLAGYYQQRSAFSNIPAIAKNVLAIGDNHGKISILQLSDGHPVTEVQLNDQFAQKNTDYPDWAISR